MTTLDKALCVRVDELVTSHQRRPFLSTMGTKAAIAELIERNEGLELAIRRLAAEVERLSALQEAKTRLSRSGDPSHRPRREG